MQNIRVNKYFLTDLEDFYVIERFSNEYVSIFNYNNDNKTLVKKNNTYELFEIIRERTNKIEKTKEIMIKSVNNLILIDALSYLYSVALNVTLNNKLK